MSFSYSNWDDIKAKATKQIIPNSWSTYSQISYNHFVVTRKKNPKNQMIVTIHPLRRTSSNSSCEQMQKKNERDVNRLPSVQRSLIYLILLGF